MRTSWRASWQSPSWSSQCFHWERLYRGMSAGMGATVINKVVVVVGAALVGTGVDVAVAGTGVETTVGASTVAVGVGGGVADDWPGAGPMSSPQSAPALARSVKSPSPRRYHCLCHFARPAQLVQEALHPLPFVRSHSRL